MSDAATAALEAIREVVEEQIKDLPDDEYVEVLEELETDCAAKVTAKREEDAMRDDAEDE
jgi:hypothetical protein